jgi:hypothetical protein
MAILSAAYVAAQIFLLVGHVFSFRRLIWLPPDLDHAEYGI